MRPPFRRQCRCYGSPPWAKSTTDEAESYLARPTAIWEKTLLRSSVASQHALHQITQRAPEVLSGALLQSVFINEQDVVLEAGIEMWLETQVNNDRVVMAVNVRVDPIETLENLADRLTEVLGEGNTWIETAFS
jgi:hypothetical protein